MTKAKAMAKAVLLNVEVEDYKRTRDGYRHIHLYSPVGFIFCDSSCHNAGAHDGLGPVDWSHIMDEMNLEPCTEAGCEICNEEID